MFIIGLNLADNQLLHIKIFKLFAMATVCIHSWKQIDNILIHFVIWVIKKKLAARDNEMTPCAVYPHVS